MQRKTTQPIPPTPSITSPTPTPTTDTPSRPDYFSTPSSTRRSTRLASKNPTPTPKEPSSSDSDSDHRARSRSRSTDAARRSAVQGMTSSKPKPKPKPLDGAVDENAKGPEPNGHLRPESAASRYWRSISRSPSPLGLIPIHRNWRVFIHKHEIPRKALHISIGFVTLTLYARDYQPAQITPVLMTVLVPIASLDVLRHAYPQLNRLYIRVCGAFMREAEAHDRYNGVIFYLLGAWAVLRFAPKDVGVMAVVLLSWCDTAASTVGRLYGRYTPRVRRGKSLAGSLAACGVGVASAVLFYGWMVPRWEGVDNAGENGFAFRGRLGWPGGVKGLLGWDEGRGVVGGKAALGLVSVLAGVVASVSEAVDVFGWDDNVTIPVLCGVGLWGFLRVFGED